VGPGSSVVIKSTILPGTTAKLQEQFPELYIFHSPEFLREVTVKYDVSHPSRNIVGIPLNSEEYIQRANFILSILPFSSYSKVIDAESAEFIKYISNGFLTMKVLFFNAMYDLIEKS
jgi:UDPglucose 6-dehydrogenase